MKRFGSALLLVLASSQAGAAVLLDGKLDEPEWDKAQRLADFQTTEPLTLAQPELKTTALVLATEEALYFGFICDQPPSMPRDRSRGQRDQFIPGDRVNLMIDFDGTGTTAYEFTAYLGGEKQDAIISRQVNYNYDWDGDWDYAVSETENQWFVEYRIPWTVAPMGAAHDGKQAIAAFFSRVVTRTGRRYSLPGNSFTRATFVADMRKLQVDAHEKARLDFFPYVAGTHDVLTNDNETRAGFDLFWKPNGQHQATVTVNPDFGQVESDQLVVNFSAIPTFFNDKRPFFTENLGLFSTEFNVLYTRRIGAAPDAGPEGVSDILGAVKVTDSDQSVSYGLIAAFEDDSSMAKGRNFYIGRARYDVTDDFTVGWIGTHVDRPTLLRQADVHALDTNWTIAPGISLGTQALLTDVQDEQSNVLNPNGTGKGGTMIFRYAPGGRIDHFTVLTSKNHAFNITDAGFMGRPSEHWAESQTDIFWRDFPETSSVQEHKLRLYANGHYNDSGERLPAYVWVKWWATRRDTRQYGLQYQASSIGGADDLVLRGNGLVATPIGHRFDAFFRTTQSGLFRAYTQLGVGQSNYDRRDGFHLFYMEPGLYPTDALSITSTWEYYNFADDLQWQGGDLLGMFDYEQQYTAINMNWFPADRHEVRVKFQWIAASGYAIGAKRPEPNGNLLATNDPISDYSFTMTAMQVRYRWEFAPQSELFAVYSRGGFDSLVEAERNQGSSFRRGLAEETDSQFLLKVRYRFALL